MAPILDNIIVFLWRLFRHWFLTYRCRNWLVVSGTIAKIECPTREMYPYAEIHYRYRITDIRLKGRCVRGFWERESAQDFTKSYYGLESVKIRYSPENHSVSYIIDADQGFRSTGRAAGLSFQLHQVLSSDLHSVSRLHSLHFGPRATHTCRPW